MESTAEKLNHVYINWLHVACTIRVLIVQLIKRGTYPHRHKPPIDQFRKKLLHVLVSNLRERIDTYMTKLIHDYEVELSVTTRENIKVIMRSLKTNIFHALPTACVTWVGSMIRTPASPSFA